MHTETTTTQRALTKRMVYCPKLSLSPEPKVILAATYLVDGKPIEANVMVSAKTYYRLMRRR